MKRLLSAMLVCLSLSLQDASAGGWLEKFIGRLDPQSEPGRLALADGETMARQELIHRVASYFRTRDHVKPLWVIRIPERKDPSGDFSRADDAVTHLITSQYGKEQFPDTLPWFGRGKRMITIARFPHFDYLAPAYFHTGNEKYALAMVRDMEDFMEHAPVSRAGWVNVQTDPMVNPWNWVFQHWRILRWIDALSFLNDSPSLPDSTYLGILNHLWEEVEWLVPRMQLGLHNGILGNIRAVIYAGMNFPEAAQGAAWLNTAMNRYRFFLDTGFYPGEVSIELTLGYSSAVLGICLGIYKAIPDSAVKASLGEPLQDLIDGHVGLMKPDRGLPRYGDHGDYDIRATYLREAASLFGRADWLALVDEAAMDSGGPSYLSYPGKSNPYYLSGYYAMRDGWGRDAQYLSMDAGPYGTNHQHGDKLSITVSADGADFIVDPGTSIYTTTKPGRLYDLRFGFLHNLVTVNGCDPSAGFDQHYQFDVMENRWVTNDLYDFLEGVYDFRSDGLEVMARRSVLYRRGEYWVVLDALYGGGDVYVESNFQFMVGTRLEIGQKRVSAVAENGATLCLASAPDGLRASVVTGDTVFPNTRFPFRYPPHVRWTPGGRGWVGGFGNHSPLDMDVTHPAPALTFKGDVSLPHYSARVFSPSLGRETRKVEVSFLETEEDRFTLRIGDPGRAGGAVDYLTWYPGSMPALYRSPQDEMGYWIRTSDGSVEEVILANAREVRFERDGLSLEIVFSDPAEGYLLRRGELWTLYLDRFLDENLKLQSFRYRDAGNPEGRFTLRGGEEHIRPGREYILESTP
jgi:hypothetical protein